MPEENAEGWIPGYKGFIRGSQHFYGSTYGRMSRSAAGHAFGPDEDGNPIDEIPPSIKGGEYLEKGSTDPTYARRADTSPTKSRRRGRGYSAAASRGDAAAADIEAERNSRSTVLDHFRGVGPRAPASFPTP